MSIIDALFSLYFAFVGAFLSVVLAKVLKQNGRVLGKLDEALGKLDEALGKLDEVLGKMDGVLGKMDEGFRLIAKLIVEENEKTRKEILEALTLQGKNRREEKDGRSQSNKEGIL